MTHKDAKSHETVPSEIEAFFTAARLESPAPGKAFLEKVELDALANMKVTRQISAVPRGWLRTIAISVGGWIGGFGLASAMALGIFVGISTPQDAVFLSSDITSELDEFAWLEDFASDTWEEL